MSAESPLFKVSQKARFSSSSRSLEVVGDNLVVHITKGGGTKAKEYPLTTVEVAKEKTGRGGSKEVKLRLQGKVKKYAFPSVADKVTFIDFLEARKLEDTLPTLLEEIEEGGRVEVVNTSRADLNGQEGTVVHSEHNANPDKERWQVTMDFNGQIMALKPINLKPVTGSAGSAAASAGTAGTPAAGEGGVIPERRRASSGAFAIAARGGTPLRSKRQGGEETHGNPEGVDRGAGAGAADAGDTSDEYDDSSVGDFGSPMRPVPPGEGDILGWDDAKGTPFDYTKKREGGVEAEGAGAGAGAGDGAAALRLDAALEGAASPGPPAGFLKSWPAKQMELWRQYRASLEAADGAGKGGGIEGGVWGYLENVAEAWRELGEEDDHDWECEFCEKGYALESECGEHEAGCAMNPALKAAEDARAQRLGRTLSVESSGAVSLLDTMASKLDTFEAEVAEMDARLTVASLEDPAVRGPATRDVGNLGAAIGKLESAKDMVFTGELDSGKAEAKIKRKAIQKRVDAAMGTVQAMGARIRASAAAGKTETAAKTVASVETAETAETAETGADPSSTTKEGKVVEVAGTAEERTAAKKAAANKKKKDKKKAKAAAAKAAAAAGGTANNVEDKKSTQGAKEAKEAKEATGATGATEGKGLEVQIKEQGAKVAALKICLKAASRLHQPKVAADIKAAVAVLLQLKADAGIDTAGGKGGKQTATNQNKATKKTKKKNGGKQGGAEAEAVATEAEEVDVVVVAPVNYVGDEVAILANHILGPAVAAANADVSVSPVCCALRIEGGNSKAVDAALVSAAADQGDYSVVQHYYVMGCDATTSSASSSSASAASSSSSSSSAASKQKAAEAKKAKAVAAAQKAKAAAVSAASEAAAAEEVAKEAKEAVAAEAAAVEATRAKAEEARAEQQHNAITHVQRVARGRKGRRASVERKEQVDEEREQAVRVAEEKARVAAAEKVAQEAKVAAEKAEREAAEVAAREMEQARIAEKKAAAARVIAEEKAEVARKKAARLAKEKAAHKAKVAAEQAEARRKEAERAEAERAEAARLQQLEQERAVAAREAAEAKAEAARVVAEAAAEEKRVAKAGRDEARAKAVAVEEGKAAARAEQRRVDAAAEKKAGAAKVAAVERKKKEDAARAVKKQKEKARELATHKKKQEKSAEEAKQKLAEKKAAREKLAVEQARIAEEKAAVDRKKKAAKLSRKHTADAEKKEESKKEAAKKGGNKKLGKVAAPSKKRCSTGSLVAVAVVCVCGVLYQLV